MGTKYLSCGNKIYWGNKIIFVSRMALISHRMIQMFNSTINMNDQIRHHYNPCNFKVSTMLFQESLGPLWSYGTWIYNLHWVPITTNVVTSNPAYDEVYSIHHYVIKFVRDWNIVTSDVKQHNPKAKKKICVFTVTRPTLIFASDPMNFYTEFG